MCIATYLGHYRGPRTKPALNRTGGSQEGRDLGDEQDDCFDMSRRLNANGLRITGWLVGLLGVSPPAQGIAALAG